MRHIRLPFLSGWWWCLGRTDEQQETQTIQLFAENPVYKTIVKDIFFKHVKYKIVLCLEDG
jgi:hypothetical protein